MPASRAVFTSLRTASSVMFSMRIRPRTTLGTTMSVPGRMKVFMCFFRCDLTFQTEESANWSAVGSRPGPAAESRCLRSARRRGPSRWSIPPGQEAKPAPAGVEGGRELVLQRHAVRRAPRGLVGYVGLRDAGVRDAGHHD